MPPKLGHKQSAETLAKIKATKQKNAIGRPKRVMSEEQKAKIRKARQNKITHRGKLLNAEESRDLQQLRNLVVFIEAGKDPDKEAILKTLRRQVAE